MLVGVPMWILLHLNSLCPITHRVPYIGRFSQNTGSKEESTLALKPLLCAAVGGPPLIISKLKLGLLRVTLTLPEQIASFYKVR